MTSINLLNFRNKKIKIKQFWCVERLYINIREYYGDNLVAGVNQVFSLLARYLKACGKTSVLQTKPVNPSQIKGLRFASEKIEDMSTKIFKIRSPKEIISDALGKNIKISKDWQDLGTFWGIKTFFTKPDSHYIYSKHINQNLFERGHISCYYDKNKLLKKFLVFDWNTKSIRKFDSAGKLITSYTPEETLAIMRYKSDSTNIHKILRHGKNVKNEAQIKESINALSKIFKTGKTNKTQGITIGYRALDDLSYKKIMSMPHDNMIYTDPSFMSIATDKKSAERFLNMKSKNHLMQVILPEETQYLEMDELGHIINPQKPENEWMLNAGTNLRIKSRDGFIFAEVVKSSN